MFVFVVSFVMYLLLSWSGSTSTQEVTIAFFLAAAVSFAAPNFSRSSFWSMKGFSPLRWWNCACCLLGPFAAALWEAGWDVTKRAITGEINSGIVKFDPRLKTDLGRMAFANSVTLMPGTLTVDVDDDGVFHVHVINLPADPTEADLAEEMACGSFVRWIRRILE